MDDTARVLGQLKGRFADVASRTTSKVFNTELIAALELTTCSTSPRPWPTRPRTATSRRGAHTRRDFTARDDQNYLYHTLCYFDPAGPRLDKKPVTLGKWEPEERKY